MSRRGSHRNRARGLALFLCLGVASCGGGPGRLGPMKKGERYPDGVSVDPPFAQPQLARKGTADAGLLMLRTPLGTERALSLVKDVFHKMTIGSTDGFDEIFTTDAQFQQPKGGYGYYGGYGYGGAVRWMKQRMSRLDYTKLSGEIIYEEREVQIYRHGDPPPADAASIRTNDLQPEELILRFPVHASRIGSTRYFGEEWIVYLRPDEVKRGRYRISMVIEDFTMQ